MEPLLTYREEIAHTTLPQLGATIPQRGNRLSRAFWSFVMRLFGWRVDGHLPDLPRFVFVGAPHTSNLDFFMTALTMAALGIDVHFVMKHTPFVGPVGWFLRWFGGIPLDRDRTRDFVSQMVDEFDGREQFLLAIMPEGTRGKDQDSATKGWRSGFYHIARGAGVPLVMVVFDYAAKCMRVGPMVNIGESYEVDLPAIQAHFVGMPGKNPERMLALGEKVGA
ncbi:MAG: 1-acyl-sn-glycerol-3-phosphate acyltransferase [Anaerolineae bacterium]|uniref:1-acyl-sn-glycerol-3-phosphate acyltransferase n=1 Tax=Promineifilum sp. TaxID=2664178 RepID=UPI001DD0EDE9|nr:1-acyl-sn-glycerol-3-phosphate acyltransferase [Anaerolineales bacterium]MCO5178803.1 1-acyl-sn-glycerol-3-phosphate acyltransferase [Promineifilum sp.]MCW5846851.1 1-acyl-sn-glycerol-3-phosphate acyltransferase [Anaerolineae bacterium]